MSSWGFASGSASLPLEDGWHLQRRGHAGGLNVALVGDLEALPAEDTLPSRKHHQKHTLLEALVLLGVPRKATQRTRTPVRMRAGPHTAWLSLLPERSALPRPRARKTNTRGRHVAPDVCSPESTAEPHATAVQGESQRSPRGAQDSLLPQRHLSPGALTRGLLGPGKPSWCIRFGQSPRSEGTLTQD